MSRSAQSALRPPSTVLTVCIGNICRSPLAEQLLRARLGQAGLGDFELLSAGLRAVVGAPMEPWPAALSREFGADPTGAVGKQLSAEIVGASDLVLTMTRGQRDDLVKRHPTAAQRTFTLAEFGRIVEALPRVDGSATASDGPLWGRPADAAAGSAVSAVVRSASSARHLAPLSAEDDVRDPINLPEEVHRAVGRQIDDLTRRIAAGLTRHLAH